MELLIHPSPPPEDITFGDSPLLGVQRLNSAVAMKLADRASDAESFPATISAVAEDKDIKAGKAAPERARQMKSCIAAILSSAHNYFIAFQIARPGARTKVTTVTGFWRMR